MVTLPSVVGLVPGARDEVGPAQAHLAARREPEVLRRWIGPEVVLLDPQLAREGDRAGAVGLVLRVVGDLEVFDDRVAVGIGRPVGDVQAERVQHGHPSLGGAVELGAHERLEQLDLVAAVGAGDPDEPAELADRRGRVAAPAHAAQRRHARVVPAVDDAVLDELGELALGRDRVGQLEPGELGLARLVGGSGSCSRNQS